MTRGKVKLTMSPSHEWLGRLPRWAGGQSAAAATKTTQHAQGNTLRRTSLDWLLNTSPITNPTKPRAKCCIEHIECQQKEAWGSRCRRVSG